MTTKTSIKDVPILTPDGAKIKVGMKVFTVVKKRIVNTERELRMQPQTRVLIMSGNPSGEIVEHEVISINTSSNSRSFVTRSDRGCENTYTVKNSCLPDNFYGKKASALKAVKDIKKQDIKNLDDKIKEEFKAIDNGRRSLRKTIDRREKVIKSYSKAKEKLRKTHTH